MEFHSIDRIIGKLEEFESWSKQEFVDIDRKIFHLMQKLEDINKNRWVLYGELTAISSIVMVIFEVAIHKFVLGG